MTTDRRTDARAGKALRFLPVLALGLLGCGQKFELPPRPPGATPPPPGYSFQTAWDMGGSAPLDLMTLSSYLFVIEEATDGSRSLRAYQTAKNDPLPSPFIGEFEELYQPHHLASARKDSVFVLVADADTIKRYPEEGGRPTFRFTDPDWRGGITGLSADNDLNVYVAYRNQIVRYDSRGRKDRVVADNRSGEGQVQEPQGIYCLGTELLAADSRTGLIVRLRASGTNSALHPAIEWPGMRPAGVVADSKGEFIYVADRGSNRILKFNYSGGALADSVYAPTKAETTLPGASLEQPRYLAEYDPLVFVSDPNQRRVVVFRLSTQ